MKRITASALKIALLGLAVFMGLLFGGESHAEQRLRVHFMNVGKGDATLLEYPCGLVLFDAGGGSDSAPVLLGYLENIFAARPELERRVDLMILSHGHLDHTRNAGEVLDRFDVGMVLTNGHLQKKGFKFLRERLLRLDGRHGVVDTEDIPADGLPLGMNDEMLCFDSGPDSRLHLLWGDARPRLHGWGKRAYRDENNHSVALLARWGQTRTLLTGDMEYASLRQLLARSASSLASVDLYQISHHGFRSGSLPAFDDHIRPRIAILSRPANRAWHRPTMTRFNVLVRERRAPVTIPVWTFDNDGADKPGVTAGEIAGTDGADGNAGHIDLGVPEGEGRVAGTAMLDGAIYWTGRDGTIVVDLYPDGELKLTAGR